MQAFIIVLTEGEYVPLILKNLSDNNYHGSVLSTKSIHHALMDTDEPMPFFGGLNKVVNNELEISRPMIFVVIKDEEIKKIAKVVNDAIDGIQGKGFMYSLNISYIEGLDE